MTDYVATWSDGKINEYTFDNAVILKSMTASGRDKKVEESVLENRSATLRLTVNGLPMDTKAFFKSFDEAVDYSIEVRARELADERVTEALTPMQEMIDELTDTLNKIDGEIRSRVGLVKDSWDYWDTEDKWNK